MTFKAFIIETGDQSYRLRTATTAKTRGSAKPHTPSARQAGKDT
jgi:hypothetical protein